MSNSIIKSIAKNIRALYDTPAEVILDLAGITGMALISYGSWLVYRPAGFIVAGILMLTFTMLSARGQA